MMEVTPTPTKLSRLDQLVRRFVPSLDDYISNQRTATVSDLREGQLNVFLSLRDAFEQGTKRGYVQLPTRTGKSVITAELAEALNARTLILEPSSLLAQQMFRQLKAFAPNSDVALHYGEQKSSWRHQIVVSTYHYAQRQFSQGSLNVANLELCIMDEGHESMGPKRSIMVRSFFEHAVILALTATSEYNSERSLRVFLGPEIHRMGIQEAVALGLNCPFRVMTAETDIDLSSVPTDFSRGDYSPGALQRILNRPSLTAAAIKLYKKMFSDQKGIIFCAGVNHSIEVAQAFNSAGISAAAITTETKEGEREALIERHRNGDLKVLTNTRVLVRGYDNPAITFSFNLSPTMSLVIAEQRGGRSLTKDPNSPDKLATIVEFLHPDRSRQRRQMTFVDVVHAAYVPEPSKSRERSAQSHSERPQLNVAGLKVSCSVANVMQVIQSRSTDRVIERIGPRKTERSDRTAHALRRVIRDFDGALYHLPSAIKILCDAEVAKGKRADKQLVGLLNTAYSQRQEDFRRLARQPMQPHVLMALASSNRDLVLHVMRKYPRVRFPHTQLGTLHFDAREAASRIEELLEGVERLSASQDSGKSLLSAMDERMNSTRENLRIDSPQFRRVQKLVNQEILPELRKLEAKIGLRWDTILSISDDISTTFTRVCAVQAQLEECAMELAECLIRGHPSAPGLRDDRRQEALLAAVEGTERFISSRSQHRFKTFISNYIEGQLKAFDRTNEPEISGRPLMILQSDFERDGEPGTVLKRQLRRRLLEEASPEAQLDWDDLHLGPALAQSLDALPSEVKDLLTSRYGLYEQEPLAADQIAANSQKSTAWAHLKIAEALRLLRLEMRSRDASSM